MTNKVNFDEINIENCYRSSCQALQNKKMAEEINFFLFLLKLSNREEDNLFHKVRKNTNGKNISESCINNEIPVCKCVKGPIKYDIPLHKKTVITKIQIKTLTIYRPLQ